MKLFTTTNLLLKHQSELFDQTINKKITLFHVLELLLVSLVGLAAFGAVMSLVVPDWWHTLNIMWKMIALIMGSIGLCLPSLYIFSSIRGLRLTLGQLLFFVLAAVTTIAVVLVSLAPISWFFLWSTDNIDIIRVINGVMIGFSLLFGLILLARLYAMSKSPFDILVPWLILVAIVTGQMSHKLAPWYPVNENTNTNIQQDL
ncbi:MAG: hypothetical protein WCV88_05650 [Patescibacteria group bacterium]|jgi:hypothetical protein